MVAVTVDYDLHRRIQVRRFEAGRDRALAAGNLSPVKRARLTHNGHGMTVAALALLAGVSAPTVLSAEAGRPTTGRTKRRIAYVLERPVDVLFPDA